MKHELLPCPRCGNRAFVTMDNAVWCVTDMCLRLPPRETAEASIAAWNTRPNTLADAELVEKVARAVEQMETHPPGGSRELVSRDLVRKVLEARASIIPTIEWKPIDLRFFTPPFRFVEPVGQEAAMVFDAKGNAVAAMMWPCHQAEDTTAAEQETYALGRLFASAVEAQRPTLTIKDQ